MRRRAALRRTAPDHTWPETLARSRAGGLPLVVTAAVALSLVLMGAAPAYSAGTGTPGRGPAEDGGRAAVARLVVAADAGSTRPGEGFPVSARGYDHAGRDLGDVTASTTFAIAPDGSCSATRCTADRPGRHTVTGTVGRGAKPVSDSTVVSVDAPKEAEPEPTPTRTPPTTPPERPPSTPEAPKHPAPGKTPAPPPREQPQQQGHTSTPGPAPARGAPSRTPAGTTPSARPAGAARLVLTPARTFAHPGEPVTWSARAYAADGRDLGDVTAVTTTAITFSAGGSSARVAEGSCSATTCAGTHYGRHTITGTAEVDGVTVTGTAALQVVPRIRWRVPLNRLATIELTPSTAVVEVGVGQAYTATGYDADHHLLGDVTSVTAFTIGPDGSCTGSSCVAAQAGPHTVTGTVDVRGRLVSGTASLLVVPRLSGLLVQPVRALVEVGHGIRYTASGLDAVGRPVVDLTAWTRFTVSPSGACEGDTCTPASPGDHLVTGTVDLGDRQVSGTAALRAIPEITRLGLLPASATVPAGGEVTFTVQGLDAGGEPVVDLTDEAVVTIAPDGSCDGTTCTATRAGPHTVTAVVDVGDRDVTGSVPLTVAPGPVATLVIGPGGDLTAGVARTFHARGTDAYGNPVGDLTTVTTFTIDPNGSCSGATCMAYRAGAHTVTGVVVQDGRTVRASLDVEVVPAPTASLTVVPVGTVTAGRPTEFRATGTDAFGNPTGDVTSDTTFTIGPDGGCSGAACTAATAGPHTVTGVLVVGGRQVVGSVVVQVAPGSVSPTPSPGPTGSGGPTPTPTPSPSPTTTPVPPATAILVVRANGAATAGAPHSYRAFASDATGKPLGEVTSRTTFSIGPDGSCSGATCTTTRAGRHTVTGTVVVSGRTVTGRLVVDVAPGRLTRLTVDPPGVVTPGQPHRFTVVGTDSYGNPLTDVATRTTIRITPDGTCTAATCTARRLGPHTVTGTVTVDGTTVTGRGTLLVLAEPVTSLRLNPRTAVVPVGGKVTHTATGLDAAGRAVVDLTDYATFSMDSGGSCAGPTCTSTAVGTHTVSGSAVVGGRRVSGRANVQVTPADPGGTPGGDLAGLELNPQSAVVDAGVPLTYIAVGLDVKGVRLGDVSVRTRFTISPDGTCTGTTCTALTPGPHTVTARITATSTASQQGSATVDPGSATVVPAALPLDDRIIGAGADAPGPAHPAAAVFSSFVSAGVAADVAEVSGTASMQATSGAPLSCEMRGDDVRDLTLTPTDGATGTPVRAEAVLDPDLAGCPVVLLVDGDIADGDTTVQRDGRAVAQTTVPEDVPENDAGQRTSTVVLATVDGRTVALASFEVVPDPTTPWWLLAVALLLLAALAAAIVQAERARRQRRWVHDHVRAEPRLTPGAVHTAALRGARPTHAVRLQPRQGPGTTDLRKEGDG